MRKYRGVRTVINLSLTLLVLIMVWGGLNHPLPWKLAYRRMERAMLLQPMEIIYQDGDGVTLSVDENNLALYTGEWFGAPMWPEELHLFPMENGVGRVLRTHSFIGMDVWAYDSSGQSVRADMELIIRRNQVQEPWVVQQTAQLQKSGFYAFHVGDYNMYQWKELALRAMVAEEIRSNMNFGGMPEEYRMDYEMTLTFYDAAGNITAVHESGGTYEN